MHQSRRCGVSNRTAGSAMLPRRLVLFPAGHVQRGCGRRPGRLVQRQRHCLRLASAPSMRRLTPVWRAGRRRCAEGCAGDAQPALRRCRPCASGGSGGTRKAHAGCHAVARNGCVSDRDTAAAERHCPASAAAQGSGRFAAGVICSVRLASQQQPCGPGLLGRHCDGQLQVITGRGWLCSWS